MICLHYPAGDSDASGILGVAALDSSLTPSYVTKTK